MGPGAGAGAGLDGSAACRTVKTWPAIVTLAVRASPGFAATLIVMVPVPLPSPPLIDTQPAPLLAVQAQPDGDETVTVSLPPVAAIESEA